VKKILFLLLLSPVAYSQEYVFVCVAEETEATATVVINTKEEFITLGLFKFDDGWKKEDINITVIKNNIYENKNAVIEFNTVTGAMSQTLFKKGQGNIEDLYEFQYNYLCQPASRLIP